MVILDVVPGPPVGDGWPEDRALSAVVPGAAPDVVDALPTRWFDCTVPAVGAEVRAHVMLALNAWAVDTDTIADAMVMLSELVGNVRDHTPSAEVGVRVQVTPDRVVVAVVEDRPSAAPADRRVAPGAPRGATPDPVDVDTRGRGLQIVDAMAGEWGFVRTGGVATAWFALPLVAALGLPGLHPA